MVGPCIFSVRLVGRVARLVSILAVYDRSRAVFNALSHEKGNIFCRWGSLWHLFGSNTEDICTERSCFMYEKVMGWCWWSVVAIVALRFGCTCVLQLPSVWSKEASVLAHQGVQEGSRSVTSSQMVTTARSCAAHTSSDSFFAKGIWEHLN